MPIFPPREVLLANKLVMEDYLNRISQLDKILTSRELVNLLEIPSDVDVDIIPAYVPEVFDQVSNVLCV